jgi:hypothetical protein
LEGLAFCLRRGARIGFAPPPMHGHRTRTQTIVSPHDSPGVTVCFGCCLRLLVYHALECVPCHQYLRTMCSRCVHPLDHWQFSTNLGGGLCQGVLQGTRVGTLPAWVQWRERRVLSCCSELQLAGDAGWRTPLIVHLFQCIDNWGLISAGCSCSGGPSARVLCFDDREVLTIK